MSQKPDPAAPLVRRFAINTTGRDLIVGDVHGCFSKLRRALDAVGFNPDAGDRLFSVGDLVDRGPESDQALEWLAQPWFFAVQGNHEDMAVSLEWPEPGMDPETYALHYARNGGAWNLANPPAARADVAHAFAAMPLAIEIETRLGLVGIVHADCPLPDWGLFSAALQSGRLAPEDLQALRAHAQWSRGRINAGVPRDVIGARAVVVGHTPVERPVALGNVLFIDTGAWLDGGAAPRAFTILDAATLDSPLPADLWRAA